LLWKGSRGQSDQFGQGAGHQHTNPRRLYGPFYLTGPRFALITIPTGPPMP
jgi:hypothetical protein